MVSDVLWLALGTRCMHLPRAQKYIVTIVYRHSLTPTALTKYPPGLKLGQTLLCVISWILFCTPYFCFLHSLCQGVAGRETPSRA